MERKIKFGLPKGSLNTPGRGDTQRVLLDAGYIVKGYESGKESNSPTIVNDPEITARLVRPQNAPAKLRAGIFDIAITGEDWVEEDRINQPDGVRRIGDLEYGQTRTVFAVSKDCKYESLSDLIRSLKGREKPITCWTEYPSLTVRAFMQNPVYQSAFGDKVPMVDYRGKPIGGENERIQINVSDGTTEGNIDEGADVIVDNTQTGDSLEKNKLRKLELILESSVGLYAGPSCVGWRENKAKWIFRSLAGAIEGKKMDDVKFDVPIPYVGKVREYLVVAGLCADEPTITLGERFAAVNILIPKMIYPRTIQTLVEDYSASAVVRRDVDQYIK